MNSFNAIQTTSSVEDSLAIIVSSCDAYSDAWDIFFKAFFLYWPNCPYKIYLISETKEYRDKRVIPIHIPEQNWSRVISQALAQIPAEYILYLQEDYFLKKSVDSHKISNLLDILKKEQSACMRLYPSPPPHKKFKYYKNIGEIEKNTSYRLSLQAALWNKKTFASLLVPGEDPWQAELQGSLRSNKYTEVFLSVTKSYKIFDYVCTGIIKRKWSYDALYFTQEHGMTLPQARELETYQQYRRRRLSALPVVGSLFKAFYILAKLARQ